MKKKLLCALICIMSVTLLSGCRLFKVTEKASELAGKTTQESSDGTIGKTGNLKEDVKEAVDQGINDATEVIMAGSEIAGGVKQINYSVNSSVFDDYDFTNEEPKKLMTRGYEEIVINSDDYSELKTSINEYNSNVKEGVNANHDEYISSMKDMLVDNPEIGIYFEVSQYSQIFRADSKFFSILSSIDSYLGGAHPYTARSGHTYDTKSGKELDAPTLFSKNPEKFCQILTDEMFEAYGDDKYEFWPLDELYDSHDDERANELMREFLYNHYFGPNKDYTLQYVLDNEKVNVIFPAYEMSYYAFGEVWVEIPFAEVADTVDDNYKLK